MIHRNVINPLCKAIAALLIGIGIMDMPYGYYTFLRLSVFVLMAILAYKYWKEGLKLSFVICLLIAIVFNPIIKVHFIKSQWSIIDMLISLFLFFWTIVDIKRLK